MVEFHFLIWSFHQCFVKTFFPVYTLLIVTSFQLSFCRYTVFFCWRNKTQFKCGWYAWEIILHILSTFSLRSLFSLLNERQEKTFNSVNDVGEKSNYYPKQNYYFDLHSKTQTGTSCEKCNSKAFRLGIFYTLLWLSSIDNECKCQILLLIYYFDCLLYTYTKEMNKTK